MHRENVHRQEVSNSSTELIFSTQVELCKIIRIPFVYKIKTVYTSMGLVYAFQNIFFSLQCLTKINEFMHLSSFDKSLL